jgi:hypothetical protein
LKAAKIIELQSFRAVANSWKPHATVQRAESWQAGSGELFLRHSGMSHQMKSKLDAEGAGGKLIILIIAQTL